MTVLKTERMALCQLAGGDADFVLELLNEPSFIRFIGDRGVRNLDDARKYLADGPIRSYADRGYGMYLVRRREDGARLGLCGLVMRDGLQDPDVGFAFLPAFRAQGYAAEAAQAVLRYAREALGLGRIVAIVTPENHSSIKLLGKIGLSFERMIRLPDDTGEIMLFASADVPCHGGQVRATTA